MVLPCAWSRLAYMAGILLGWLYARRLVARAELWGGKPPMTVPQVDEFAVVVDHTRHRGRRSRLGFVLFYEPSYFSA